MKKVYISSALALLPLLTLFAAQIEPHKANTSNIRVVGVEPTPEGDHIETHIVFPKDGEVEGGSPVAIQVFLEGYPLGTDSDFPRRHEISNDKSGQSLHVVIDNYPYFELNEAFVTSIDDSEEYYDQILEFDIPFELSPGKHVIRAFPARSFGESLKDEGTMGVSIFYYGEATETPGMDIDQPFLTYNEPQGTYIYSKKAPILLDFLLTNAMPSPDGYKIRLTIDGKTVRNLVSVGPYFVYGLSLGKHTIRLELLDADNSKVPGVFNDVIQAIRVIE